MNPTKDCPLSEDLNGPSRVNNQRTVCVNLGITKVEKLSDYKLILIAMDGIQFP